METGMRKLLTAAGVVAALMVAPATASAQTAGYGPVPNTPPQATTPPVTTLAPPATPPAAPPVVPVGGELPVTETNEVAPPEEGGVAPTTQASPRERGTTPAVASKPVGGNLPFTGLEVGFVVGAGLLLVAAGLLLRRTRHDH
jgi:hypothetical protein